MPATTAETEIIPIEDTGTVKAAKLEYASLTAEASDRLRFQFEFAQSGIRGLTIANGGALIALFTFIGNVGRDGAVSYNSTAIWWAFGWFVVGLVCALIATMAAFFSQMWFFYSTKREAWNAQARIIGAKEAEDPAPDMLRGQWAFGFGLFVLAIGTVAFAVGAAVALSGVL